MPDPHSNPSRSPADDGSPAIARIEAILREDAAFEPPARLVDLVRRMGTERLAPRRAGSRAAAGISEWTSAWNAAWNTTVGSIFDDAGAVVRAWLTPQGGLAFAGLRDDRGADIIALDEPAADLSVRAERTPTRHGRVRIVGESTRLDGSSVRARIVLLDRARRVLKVEESDALGMFALDLADGTAVLAIVPRGGTGVLLELDAGDRPSSEARP